jgi:hypothetical protein
LIGAASWLGHRTPACHEVTTSGAGRKQAAATAAGNHTQKVPFPMCMNAVAGVLGRSFWSELTYKPSRCSGQARGSISRAA